MWDCSRLTSWRSRFLCPRLALSVSVRPSCVFDNRHRGPKIKNVRYSDASFRICYIQLYSKPFGSVECLCLCHDCHLLKLVFSALSGRDSGAWRRGLLPPRHSGRPSAAAHHLQSRWNSTVRNRSSLLRARVVSVWVGSSVGRLSCSVVKPFPVPVCSRCEPGLLCPYVGVWVYGGGNSLSSPAAASKPPQPSPSVQGKP